jgi:hypothetical protein
VSLSFLGCSLVGLSLLAGCPDRTISEVIPQQGRVEYKDIPVTVNRDVDILFLIDDSPSMADKQTNLQANFPNFINVLNTIQGGLPNIHLGVATSDLGSSGADDSSPAPSIPGCSGNGKAGALHGASVVTGPYITDIADNNGGRQTNYTGTLSDAFTAIASVGTAGCGFEQHLEAVKRALNNNPSNAGFLRSSAYLAVVILGDEDDCSIAHGSLLTTDTSQLGPLQSFRCTRYGVTCDQGGQTPDAMNQIGPKDSCHSNESKQYLTDVQRYVDFLKGLKSDPSQVIVADIGGPPTPVATVLNAPPGTTQQIPSLAHSCTYTGGNNEVEVADPTVRVNQFLAGFPNRSTFSTICQQDLSGALEQIAELLRTVIGSPCIDGRLATPYDCSVSDVTNYGTAQQTETVLPECNNTGTPSSSTNKPCWAIEVDAMNCSMSPGMLTLKVERDQAPPPNTHVISYCVTDTTCMKDSDCGQGSTCDLSMGTPGICK